MTRTARSGHGGFGLVRSAVLAAVVVCVSTTAVPAAWGTPAAGGDPEPLIQEGIAFRRAGDDLAALKKFEQAYGIRKSPRTVAQIGLAEQALGRWAAADRHLHEALGAATDSWIQKNRASIEQALRVISSHVGELDIGGTPVGAEVRVDGDLVGRLPLPTPVKATVGGVAMEVRAPGYLSIVRSATVSAGSLTRETFNLQRLSPLSDVSAAPEGGGAAAGRGSSGPSGVQPAEVGSGARPADLSRGATEAAAQSDTPGASPAESGRSSNAADADATGEGVSRQRVLTFVTLGLAAGTLAFAIIEHASWQNKVSSFESMSNCDPEAPMKGGTTCMTIFNDGQHAKTLALVGYALSGAFALTTAILYLTDPGPSARAQKIACAPAVTTVGLSCAGWF